MAPPAAVGVSPAPTKTSATPSKPPALKGAKEGEKEDDVEKSEKKTKKSRLRGCANPILHGMASHTSHQPHIPRQEREAAQEQQALGMYKALLVLGASRSLRTA